MQYRLPTPKQSHFAILPAVAAAAVAAAIFVVDLITHPEISVAPLYAAVVLLVVKVLGEPLRVGASATVTARRAQEVLRSISTITTMNMTTVRPMPLPAATTTMPMTTHTVRDDHHGHHHGPGEACHHIVDAKDVSGPMSWRKITAVVFSVGIRPCSGAILVLIFALTQGLFWAGVAATFAMAFGTALTVAGLATLALGSRRASRRQERRVGRRCVGGLRHRRGDAHRSIWRNALRCVIGTRAAFLSKEGLAALVDRSAYRRVRLCPALWRLTSLHRSYSLFRFSV